MGLLPNPESIDNKRWAWQKRAACNGAPVTDQIAFTTSGAAGRSGIAESPRVKDLSKRYCDVCPVLAECFAWADADEYFVGVAAARAWTQEYRYTQHEERMKRQRAVAVGAAETEYEEWAA